MKKRISVFLLTLVLAVAMVIPMAIPVTAADADLVGWWRFNGDTLDASGNGNVGTLHGDATYAVSWFGKALSLDGSGDYVDVGSAVDDAVTSGLTVEAWIKPNSKQNGGIISSDITYISRQGVDFFLWADGTYGRLYIDFGDSSTLGRTYWDIPSSTWYAQWHHVAASWDGVTPRLYVDGGEVANIPYVGSYSDPGKSVLIGAIDHGGITYFFNGLIDDARIWKRTLTAGEIASHSSLPYGEILAPETGEVFNPGDAITFDAIYYDDDYDAVQWAVRKGTSASGAPNVWGNVDGSNDPFTWDGHIFNSVAPETETINWVPDVYYALVWNPTNDAGEPNIRLIRSFRINAPPVVTINSPADFSVYMVGDEVTLGVSFTDPDAGDIHTADIDWNYNSGIHVPIGSVTSPFSASHTYNTTGLYTIEVAVTDNHNGTGTAYVTVVVYDPSAGFVTGGGWIYSELGNYRADPSLEGKATFGFVSKYKKGATTPDGQTEFQFKAGSLNFHSSSYEWLVVTGSNFAKFKGIGTINGEGEYKFQIWAGDGEPDTFRIKIWEENGGEVVIYDNGMDQAIGGGSIVVHTK